MVDARLRAETLYGLAMSEWAQCLRFLEELQRKPSYAYAGCAFKAVVDASLQMVEILAAGKLPVNGDGEAFLVAGIETTAETTQSFRNAAYEAVANHFYMEGKRPQRSHCRSVSLLGQVP